MISTLLDMHKIKYIISVDDCYFAPKQEEIKAAVFSEMCTSMEPFKECLMKIGESALLDEIDSLSDLDMEGDVLIENMLKEIAEGDLLELYSIINSQNSYMEEQNGILAFLQDLKQGGQIEDYLTVYSTMEAAKIDCNDVGMNDGNILWLLDRDFSQVGESTEAGIQFAKTLIQRQSEQDNYVYILSAVAKDSDISEDDLEREFDEVLFSTCQAEESSFIYYINKERIRPDKKDKFAKSLAQGFKRKACYEIFKAYSECLHKSQCASLKMIFDMKQKTLNYLLSQKITEKGESHIDFIARFVHIFHTNEYNKFLSLEHDFIAKKIHYYEELSEKVKDGCGNTNEMTPILKVVREMELYNKHINSQHLEISTGDIFKVGELYYILVSQSCDTYLRINGKRKLDYATLLQIEDAVAGKDEYCYKLSCFDGFKKPYISYQKIVTIPFDILDLCVFNDNGEACIETEYIEKVKTPMLIGYTKNFNYRLAIILEHIRLVYKNQRVVEQFFAQEKEVSSKEAQSAYEALTNETPFMKKYKISDGRFSYSAQRVCRLDELTTVDIIKEYGTVLSRIGHPFDFL